MQTHQACTLTIGITSADDPTPDNYVKAIQSYGATAVVLGSKLEDLEFDLEHIDGLLITGGTDINPELYGADRLSTSDQPDYLRDEYEKMAISKATEYGIPLLMICRGMQMGNIVFGGSLHQHLPDVVDGTVVHSDPERKFETFAEHQVIVEPESLLAEIVGVLEFPTNATHHQAIDRLGADLRVVARTPDGIIEAIERPTAPTFWLGTQWHPERLLDADDGRSERILQAFINASHHHAHATGRH